MNKIQYFYYYYYYYYYHYYYYYYYFYYCYFYYYLLLILFMLIYFSPDTTASNVVSSWDPLCKRATRKSRQARARNANRKAPLPSTKNKPSTATTRKSPFKNRPGPCRPAGYRAPRTSFCCTRQPFFFFFKNLFLCKFFFFFVKSVH
jgi:hypothetical protein